jgi:hypothetical protein
VDDWILTYTGKRFSLADPHPEQVDINDIAHALSLVNRWGGHTRMPYSVAAHSVMVADLVAKIAPDLALAALLHDAPEAYLGDVCRPLKRRLLFVGPTGSQAALSAHDDLILFTIFTALAVTWPGDDGWKVIRAADDRVLVAERQQLLPPAADDGAFAELGRPPAVTCRAMDSFAAESLFLTTFSSLRVGA